MSANLVNICGGDGTQIQNTTADKEKQRRERKVQNKQQTIWQRKEEPDLYLYVYTTDDWTKTITKEN